MSESTNMKEVYQAASDIASALSDMLAEYEFELKVDKTGALMLQLFDYEEPINLGSRLTCKSLTKLEEQFAEQAAKYLSTREAELQSMRDKKFWAIVCDSEKVEYVQIVSIDPDDEENPYAYEVVDDAYDSGWCGDEDLFTTREEAFAALRARERKAYEDRCKQIDEQEGS